MIFFFFFFVKDVSFQENNCSFSKRSRCKPCMLSRLLVKLQFDVQKFSQAYFGPCQTFFLPKIIAFNPLVPGATKRAHKLKQTESCRFV